MQSVTHWLFDPSKVMAAVSPSNGARKAGLLFARLGPGTEASGLVRIAPLNSSTFSLWVFSNHNASGDGVGVVVGFLVGVAVGFLVGVGVAFLVGVGVGFLVGVGVAFLVAVGVAADAIVACAVATKANITIATPMRATSHAIPGLFSRDFPVILVSF